MTTKEYLQQAYRLDQKINSDIAEVNALRGMAASVSSQQLSDRVQTSRRGEAPYVRSLEKIMEMEDKINAEIDLLVDLKDEIRSIITTVANTDERMVLRYRYVHNYTWEQIANELHVDARTVRRWHGNALRHVVLPKKLIVV